MLTCDFKSVRFKYLELVKLIIANLPTQHQNLLANSYPDNEPSTLVV
jgi:hypothetical protein